VWFACALGTGCAGEQMPAQTAAEYQSRAERAYAEALVEFLDQNWEYAAQLMEDVHRNYGTTEYARMAELRLADIAFHQEQYPEAISAYKAYVHDHPNDPEVPYARYRALRAHFLVSSNNVFQPPLEERDLASVRDAYAALRAFVADYPDYKQQAELKYMIESVSGMLARHELYVARFYANLDEFDAAVMRVQYSLRTFQGSGLEAEGVVLLGEIYLKMKQTARARALFEHVLSNYPDSAFKEVAQRFLDELPQGEAAAKIASGSNVSDLAWL
jgi:outer membrane protein assembly factor BamD